MSNANTSTAVVGHNVELLDERVLARLVDGNSEPDEHDDLVLLQKQIPFITTLRLNRGLRLLIPPQVCGNPQHM